MSVLGSIKEHACKEPKTLSRGLLVTIPTVFVEVMFFKKIY